MYISLSRFKLPLQRQLHGGGSRRKTLSACQTLLDVMAGSGTIATIIAMPSYCITIINEHFSQSGEHQADDDIAAWKEAISSAINIAGDQVSHGNPFFGAEVVLTQGDEQLGRYVVSVGATPLKD